MKKFLSVLLSLICFLSPYTVSAAELPAITDDPMTLTIDFHKDGTDGSRTTLEGATFSVYQVADLEVKNGCAYYTVISPYTSLAVIQDGIDVTFDGMTEEESDSFAEKAQELTEEADAAGTTGSNGCATIDIQKKGMYLVVETDKAGTAAHYTNVTPFLVSVPFSEEQDNSCSWLYDVTVNPKTTVEKAETPVTTPTPQEHFNSGSHGNTEASASVAKNVKTGDASNVEAWLILIGLAAAGGVILSLVKKKK